MDIDPVITDISDADIEIIKGCMDSIESVFSESSLAVAHLSCRSLILQKVYVRFISCFEYEIVLYALLILLQVLLLHFLVNVLSKRGIGIFDKFSILLLTDIVKEHFEGKKAKVVLYYSEKVASSIEDARRSTSVDGGGIGVLQSSSSKRFLKRWDDFNKNILEASGDQLRILEARRSSYVNNFLQYRYNEVCCIVFKVIITYWLCLIFNSYCLLLSLVCFLLVSRNYR